MRLLTTVLRLAAVGSAVASQSLGTWFGYVPVESDPGYVRAMRLFGRRLWRGSPPFPVIGEHLSSRAGATRAPGGVGAKEWTVTCEALPETLVGECKLPWRPQVGTHGTPIGERQQGYQCGNMVSSIQLHVHKPTTATHPSLFAAAPSAFLVALVATLLPRPSQIFWQPRHGMLSQSAFAPAVTQAKLAAAAPAGPDDTDGGSQAAARSSRAGAATAPPHPHPHPHPQPHDDLMTTMLHPPGHLPPHRHHPHPQRRSHTVCQPLLPGEALAAIASYGAEAEAGECRRVRARACMAAGACVHGMPYMCWIGAAVRVHMCAAGPGRLGLELTQLTTMRLWARRYWHCAHFSFPYNGTRNQVIRGSEVSWRRDC